MDSNWRRRCTNGVGWISAGSWLLLTAMIFALPAFAQETQNEVDQRAEMARMALEEGDIDYAAAQFLKVLKLNPNHGASHRSLGTIYEKQKKDADAYRHLKTYLNLTPKAPDRPAVEALLLELADRLKTAGKTWVLDDPSKPWRPDVLPEPDELGFVAIQGGTFLMGGAFKNEQPIHLVAVSNFELMDHEITNAEYFAFTRATKYKSPEHWQEDWFWMSEAANHPIVNIFWEDADAYCKWLDARLPTEAEWEYACRGGSTQAQYPWGDDPPDETRANFGQVFKTPYPTKPVKSYPPNAYNLYDLSGNVWEWCSDWYQANYYQVSPAQNPQGPEKGFDYQHTRRGGQWQNSPVSLRCARRYGGEPSAQDNGSTAYFGFRCAR